MLTEKYSGISNYTNNISYKKVRIKNISNLYQYYKTKLSEKNIIIFH